MVFAQAFQKAYEQKGEKIESKIPTQSQMVTTNPEEIPRMYRAQVSGRCSLQFAGDNRDLKKWTEEWVDPDEKRNREPRYQHQEPTLELDNNGSIYRFKVSFPFRVFTDCGQDSILRPVMGKHGIPFIPGSSIKGLFRRLLNDSQRSQESKAKIAEYCGSEECPGSLRFHGAYPIGDWAGTQQITFDSEKQKTEITETRYRIVDVVHPQQRKQILGQTNTTAIASISLHQPQLVFEFSSTDKNFDANDWQTIKGMLKTALRPGLGGKTSSGYGLCYLPQNKYALNIHLQGVGISSLLRDRQPEFRLNMFKASLRGHVSRILSGVCGDKHKVKTKTEKLFGSTHNVGTTKIYWESDPEFPQYRVQGNEETPIYRVKGTLRIDAPKEDIELIRMVTAFAYIMGGIGKSWRRTWHKGSHAGWHPGFYPHYKTRAIGCYWEALDEELEQASIASPQNLKKFLNRLHALAKKYMGLLENTNQHLNWKEAWYKGNVRVYSREVSNSNDIKNTINLFHNESFKYTPAIGGKKIIRDTKSSKDKTKFLVSNIWHRVLPLSKENRYLEIFSIFDGKSQDWKNQEVAQKSSFIDCLKDEGFKFIW